MLHFIINSKNYQEAAGENALRLGAATQRVEQACNIKRGVEKIEYCLAVPAFSIAILSQRCPDLSIFAQHLDLVESGSTTGFLVPEIAKLSGASGSILNHSEHRVPLLQIRKSILKLKELGMKSLVCARNEREVETFAKFQPDFVAIEPPELIGSGNAVSKARPELISNSKKALNRGLEGVRTKRTVLLCGAGIIESLDAKRAIELGAEGILVASGVIKAENWFSTIKSLSAGLCAGKQK